MAPSISASQETLDCSSGQEPAILTTPTGQTSVQISPRKSGWLKIEERGHQVVIAAQQPVGTTFRISQPLRYGQHWTQVQADTPVQISFLEAFGRNRDFGASLHCSPNFPGNLNASWLQALSAIDAQLNAPKDSDDVRRTLESLAALETSSSSPIERALVLHYRALAYTVAGNPVESVRLFQSAEKAWLDLGDTQRSLAAHLGRIEEEYSARDLKRVIEDTDFLASTTPLSSYFLARMLNTRCVALSELDHIDEAQGCYQSVLQTLRQIDEMPEYANSLYNLANLMRQRGNLVLASELANEGLGVASGPHAPMTQGRFHLLLGAIERGRGNISQAFTHAMHAASSFADAGGDSLSWRASSHLFNARLLEQIGSYHEAYAELSGALELSPTKSTPVLLARTANVFFDLEADTGHYFSAIAAAYASESIYDRLGMKSAEDWVALQRLQLQIEHGDYAQVESEIVNHHSHMPLYEPRWALLGAALALRQGRSVNARITLDAIRRAPMTLPDQMRYAQTEAEYLARVGDVSAAQHTLLDTATQIHIIARRSGNPALRSVITRQGLSLRRMALGMALNQSRVAGADPITTIWPWLDLSASDASVAMAGAQSGKTAEQFDRAVATELLDTTSAGNQSSSNSRQELLQLLALQSDSNQASGSAPISTTLRALQQRLEADSVFVSYLEGNFSGGLLLITHDAARIVDVATPEDIRSAALELTNALHSPSTPMSETQNAANELSTRLLGGAAGTAPPKRLLILADELTSRIPWSTLSWPGQRYPLLETTAIELVRLTGPDIDEASPSAAQLQIIVASQSQQRAGLEALATADAEPLLISSAIASSGDPAHQRAIRISEGAAATRSAVLSALDTPGGWVHIAAHGMAQPHRIGYAGLWLAPAPAQTPQFPHSATQASSPTATAPATVTEASDKLPAFLSWLDILERGVRADLVVLNACQLGDSGTAINGNLSFADAVSRAGARQVVAASWPVSDAAAALWVPEFYSTLAADPEHNAANALRAAQLRLRQSRAFAHPFFWAGMQTISRLSVPP